jgi:hypothetical protein
MPNNSSEAVAVASAPVVYEDYSPRTIPQETITQQPGKLGPVVVKDAVKDADKGKVPPIAEPLRALGYATTLGGACGALTVFTAGVVLPHVGNTIEPFVLATAGQQVANSMFHVELFQTAAQVQAAYNAGMTPLAMTKVGTGLCAATGTGVAIGAVSSAATVGVYYGAKALINWARKDSSAKSTVNQ